MSGSRDTTAPGQETSSLTYDLFICTLSHSPPSLRVLLLFVRSPSAPLDPAAAASLLRVLVPSQDPILFVFSRVKKAPWLATDAEMETSGMEEEAASAAGPARVVKVKRKLVASCLTCPICNKLLRDATTISECLHTCEHTRLLLSSPLRFFLLFGSRLSEVSWSWSMALYLVYEDSSWGLVAPVFVLCDISASRYSFVVTNYMPVICRKCIYEKLDEEETDCCPVCNIHLGCLPVEKLRADHNLQDLRAKIFPLKKPKNGACDSAPSIILPVRRKEISLSSLVNSPRVTAQTGPTGRRKKSVGNKTAAFHGCESAVCKNEDDTTDKFVKKSSSNGNSIKQSLSGRQACSNSNSSYSNANKNTENGDKTIEDREELWEPLNCLVEAANRTKSSRSGSQNPIIKPEKKKLLDGDTNTNKTIIEHLHESKAQDEKDGNFQTARMKVKARSLKAVNEKKGTLVNSTQTLLDAQSDKKIAPLWFSLVASSDKLRSLRTG
ncbi:hypothetical protein ZIOFF_009199 [Zingiber officinale]|uniref:Uncharacterized protein n=1 Tax=Zingiber officinale TaxID=94328 RepID=A0A8J5I2F8_ZINOF|nr:hypothetical protein ZIOFF_009199 [Zingiber officinale]